ncbi:MAG: sigma 54-interacting transcriptional regulator [Minicystis sp.]
MLIGPTGAGKEELARCYHLHSGRAGGPFVMFRCQNMVGDFGYIDLFGVIKGAVHDVEAREGAVEQANHGTLFLDEIQDLRPREQAHLLGFTNYVRQPDGSVRRGEFSRMGEKDRRKPRYADDVNLVCASLRDLEDPEVRRDLGFREDLLVPPGSAGDPRAAARGAAGGRACFPGEPPAGRAGEAGRRAHA